jgi:hypothetical protein
MSKPSLEPGVEHEHSECEIYFARWVTLDGSCHTGTLQSSIDRKRIPTESDGFLSKMLKLRYGHNESYVMAYIMGIYDATGNSRLNISKDERLLY